LLLPALGLLYWETYGVMHWRRRDLLWFLIAPTGLLAFMWYLYLLTGNPFAFKDIQAAWGRESAFFLVPLTSYLRHPLILADGWDFRIINFLTAVFSLTCGVLLLKQRQWALALYVVLAQVFTLSSLLLQSQARYALVLFPAFMILGRFGDHPRMDQAIRSICMVLLALFTAMFALHMVVAMS
jgi:hypothetical protein